MGTPVTAQEFFSEPTETSAPEGPKTVSPEEFFGTEEPTAGVPSIADEHESGFISKVGDAFHRMMGGLQEGNATANEVFGSFLRLTPVGMGPVGEKVMDAYDKTFVDPGKAAGEQARIDAPGEGVFEKSLFSFAEAMGSMPPVILSDVMTGTAGRMALANRVLPMAEAMLSKIPNFVLGSGWRGFMDGGVSQAAENMSFGLLFAKSGTGLQGIGKMASLGLAQSFYNAAKEGRLPTQDEMIDSTAQAGMMGVVFSVLPHLTEAAQEKGEKKALGKYAKKAETITAEEGITVYHGTPFDISIGDLRPSRIGEFGPGIYTTASKEYAESWKPRLQKSGGALAEGGKVLNANIKESDFLTIETGKPTSLFEKFPGKDDAETVQKVLAAGFKGVKYTRENGVTDYVIYDKTAFSSPVPKVTPNPAELQKAVTDLLADDKIRPEVRETVAKILTSWKDSRGEVAPSEFLLGNWKDSPQLLLNINTMERNFEKVAPADAPELKATITDRIKENETAHNRWRSALITGIQEEMVNRGIKPNSPESALAFKYGEKRMTLAELKAATPNWEGVTKAAEFSRWVYDTTLESLNEARVKHGYDPIPKRADYFRHFQEVHDMTNDLGFFFNKSAMKNWMASLKERSSRAGVAVDPKSGKPFTSTELRREGTATKEDAVLALQNYVKSAGPQLFHLDSVARVRNLESYIREQAHVNELAMKDGKPYVKVDLANFQNTLNMYGDLLAGQKTDLSRTAERWVGRPFIAMTRALSRGMTANMIGYNISSSLMNVLPFAQNAEFAVNHPLATMRGILYAASHMEHDAPFEINGARSALNDRRYPKSFLPENWRENVVSKGFVLPNLVDRFTTRAIIAGRAFGALREGANPEEAMKIGDTYAERIVADRSKGQLPNIMAEPDMNLLAKFQVEQANLFAYLLHDIPQNAKGDFAKAFGSAAIYSIASLVMNQVFEKGVPQVFIPGMGRRPLPDPIYLLGTLLGWTQAGENRPFEERIKPAFKQFSGAVPFGNIVLEGGRFPLSAAIPDKTMFDSKESFINQMKKPLTYLVNPLGGGGQIKKMIEGTMSAARGYTTTPAGNLQYEVQSDFMNYVRGFLFGKNAFPEALAHWSKPKGGSD